MSKTDMYNNQEDEKIVLQPFNHFKQLPPLDDFIAKIWAASNYWFQVPKDDLKKITILANKLVAAIYLIDDLTDNAQLRRGIVASHLVYGNSRAIYGSIYGAISAMAKFDELKVIDGFITLGLNLFQGQAMEMYFTRNGICPSEKEYQETVVKKTTSAISFSFLLQQIFARTHKTSDFEPFLVTLGLFFQICNDYISLTSRSYADLKTFGDDITEGIFTFPVIHGIRKRPEHHRLKDILKQRTTDQNLKLHFVKLLQEFGSFDYTLQTLAKLKHNCVEEMKKIGPNPEMENLLNDALNHIGALVM
ncbi:hypothetical protein Zmor_027715 [Zophobas morio]|uniref:Geranylgeranyl pyrophosphate synthase n=1 Tax=Zophobas morio TaxID=2755281 RepID=A0AA38HP31_9CUCU|nr:hypothetical protein Zmor_027715 [Zophobas morio]